MGCILQEIAILENPNPSKWSHMTVIIDLNILEKLRPLDYFTNLAFYSCNIVLSHYGQLEKMQKNQICTWDFVVGLL